MSLQHLLEEISWSFATQFESFNDSTREIRQSLACEPSAQSFVRSTDSDKQTDLWKIFEKSMEDLWKIYCIDTGHDSS